MDSPAITPILDALAVRRLEGEMRNRHGGMSERGRVLVIGAQGVLGSFIARAFAREGW